MEIKELEFRDNLNIFELLGYSKYIAYTQAYHESGGFKKVIGDYNFWGITKPRIWTGKTLFIDTHEYINRVKTPMKRLFIDFENINEAINWYDNLIRHLYPFSFGHKKDYKDFYEGLVTGKYKYATDPNYAKKLIELHELFINNSVLRG